MLLPADDNIVLASTSIRDALQKLENSPIKIILVVDGDGRLVGTCTDGDFRRAILESGNLDGRIEDIANKSPVSVEEDFHVGDMQSFMRDRNIKHLPVIDRRGVLKGLYHPGDAPKPDELTIPVVLMAGGRGSRLAPLTEECPKPLLRLGDKPILQIILERFAEQGFKRFYISVNYLGHMIEEYFGDGEQFGVEISYLREYKRLGTAGALSLLPQNMSYPFLVMNGDLLTGMDFRSLARQHLESGAAATMCVREHMTTIQFGVVKFHGDTYINTEEKPTITQHINAGVYCLSRDAREIIPQDEFYDMPTLFEDLSSRQKPCGVHILHGSWLDIGTVTEYEAAKKRFD